MGSFEILNLQFIGSIENILGGVFDALRVLLNTGIGSGQPLP